MLKVMEARLLSTLRCDLVSDDQLYFIAIESIDELCAVVILERDSSQVLNPKEWTKSLFFSGCGFGVKRRLPVTTKGIVSRMLQSDRNP